MKYKDRERLEEARITAVKSATEIINGITRLLVFKDIDLWLINNFVIGRSDSLYAVCEDWSKRDYRKSGLYYGGGTGILALLLYASNALAYLPLSLLIIMAVRYVFLCRQLNIFATRKTVHMHIMHISQYLILKNQLEGRKTILRDIASKYTALKYIKDRRSVTGRQFMQMFVDMDRELGFYRLLNGIIDDVLIYAIESYDATGINATRQPATHHEAPFHRSPPQSFLQDSPEHSRQKFAAAASTAFTSALAERESEGQSHVNATTDRQNALSAPLERPVPPQTAHSPARERTRSQESPPETTASHAASTTPEDDPDAKKDSKSPSAREDDEDFFNLDAIDTATDEWEAPDTQEAEGEDDDESVSDIDIQDLDELEISGEDLR